jgi:hypothetical protein
MGLASRLSNAPTGFCSSLCQKVVGGWKTVIVYSLLLKSATLQCRLQHINAVLHEPTNVGIVRVRPVVSLAQSLLSVGGYSGIS